MLNANYSAASERSAEIDLLEAFNSGIGPFERELDKLTDHEYVTLLTLLDEYRSPFYRTFNYYCAKDGTLLCFPIIATALHSRARYLVPPLAVSL